MIFGGYSMSTFAVYAIAAPLNAFICCSFITFFMKKMNLSSIKRLVITFCIYALIAFGMCAGGNGILNIDMSVFNLPLFLLYISSGFCVCIGIYCFYERDRLADKYHEKKRAKKASK